MNLEKNWLKHKTNKKYADSSFGIIGYEITKEKIFTCNSKKATALGKVPSISTVQLT
jgi:hypothetical protein